MMQNKQTRGKDARLPGDAVNSHYAIDVSTTVTLVIPISQQTTEKTHILEAEPLINISIYTNTNTNVTRVLQTYPFPEGKGASLIEKKLTIMVITPHKHRGCAGSAFSTAFTQRGTKAVPTAPAPIPAREQSHLSTCISFLKAWACSAVGWATLSTFTATSPCHRPRNTVPNEPVPILFSSCTSLGGTSQ